MNVWAAWRGLLAQQETGESLALFRILVGIGALWGIVETVPHGVWRILWTTDGYLGNVPDPETVALVMAGGSAAALAVVLGLGGRVAAFVALQSCLFLFDLNPQDAGAHDRFTTNGLWLLVLADSTATVSVDCRLRTGAWTSDRLISAWPRYLAIIQIVLAYWATGVQKVSAEWTPFGDFTALWFIVRSPLYMRFDVPGMPFWFTQVATALTWVWEWCAPIWLYAFWCRAHRGPRHWANRIDLRSLWAAFGVAMHANLFVLTSLGALQWVTLAWYATLFHPDEIRRAIGRYKRWRSGRATRALSATRVPWTPTT